jgi:hypothetical protein
MTDEELATEKRLAHEREVNASSGTGSAMVATGGSNPAIAVFAWVAVGIPIIYGISVTLQKASVLFK